MLTEILPSRRALATLLPALRAINEDNFTSIINARQVRPYLHAKWKSRRDNRRAALVPNTGIRKSAGYVPKLMSAASRETFGPHLSSVRLNMQNAASIARRSNVRVTLRLRQIFRLAGKSKISFQENSTIPRPINALEKFIAPQNARAILTSKNCSSLSIGRGTKRSSRASL